MIHVLMRTASPIYHSMTLDLFHLSADFCLAAESEREEEEEEEVEEEEALYELVNRETHSDYLTASESDGGQEACEAELSDPGEKEEKEEVEKEEEDAANSESEENSQRALIEDIRCSYTVTCI